MQWANWVAGETALELPLLSILALLPYLCMDSQVHMQTSVTLSLCLICTLEMLKKVNVSLNIGLLNIVRPKEIKHDMPKRIRTVGTVGAQSLRC